MTWDDVVASGLKLPGMEVSTSYGTPALKVRGKLVTRVRTEDDSLVILGVPIDEREMLRTLGCFTPRPIMLAIQQCSRGLRR